MFESPDQLLLGLVTGIGFGFLLQKGRVAKYQTILSQLLLKDWTVVKIMATAVVVGAAGVYALVAVGAARLDIWTRRPNGTTRSRRPLQSRDAPRGHLNGPLPAEMCTE